MSDKNLTTFLTEWGGQVKALIEPSTKEKLEPSIVWNSYYSGGAWDFAFTVTSDSANVTVDVTSDGNAVSSYTKNLIDYVSAPLPANDYGSINCTVYSGETDNYKEGIFTTAEFYTD